MSEFYLNTGADTGTVIANFVRFVRGLNVKKKWFVSVEQVHNVRSHKQNRYYWGVVVRTICEWYKETQGRSVSGEVLHEHTLKKYYCPVRTVVTAEGHEVKHFISTKKLLTYQFNDMIDEIRNDFAEMGCYIPEPDPDFKKHERRPKAEAA